MQTRSQAARELVVLGMALATPKREWVGQYLSAIDCGGQLAANASQILTADRLQAIRAGDQGKIGMVMASLGVTRRSCDATVHDLISLTADVHAESIVKQLIGKQRFYPNALGSDLMRIERYRQQAAESVRQIRDGGGA